MSPVLPLLVTAGLALAATRPVGWPAATDADVKRDTVLVQVTRTMTLDLPAAADTVFPLFGPVRETEWSPDWRPVFVTPPAGGQGPDGAVFTVDGDPDSAIWVMTDYELRSRRVCYVVLNPGKRVTQLWIEVRPVGPHAAQVDVTHRITRLGSDRDPGLDRFVAGSPHRKTHWEGALRAALARHAGAASSGP